MVEIIQFKDIVENNGKTIEENNLNNSHKYPVGAKVKVTTGEVTTTMYVIKQTRDCDGTPLYTTSPIPGLNQKVLNKAIHDSNYHDTMIKISDVLVHNGIDENNMEAIDD